MNSNCPSCETILRNPRACSCGWALSEHVAMPKPANKGRDSEEYKRFMQLAKRISSHEPYEPGAEG
jgi:hypothetical protein